MVVHVIFGRSIYACSVLGGHSIACSYTSSYTLGSIPRGARKLGMYDRDRVGAFVGKGHRLVQRIGDLRQAPLRVVFHRLGVGLVRATTTISRGARSRSSTLREATPARAGPRAG